MRTLNIQILTLLICLFTITANAQLKGDHVLGDIGMEAGTQAPPSLSIAIPLYFYNASALKKSNGSISHVNPDLNTFITGVGISYVSNLKILGANYGASVLLPFAQNRIEGNVISSKSSFAFSDTYFQPIQLGWHTKRADFLATYSLYMPTGKYVKGDDNNSGLGIWGNEFAAGTTLYFDPQRSFNFSTLLSYEFNSKKKNTDIKPGDLLSIEGGLSKTFLLLKANTSAPSSIAKVGMVYYMQYKTSSDQIPAADQMFTGSKDHIYALGAEGNIFLIKPQLSFGLRWLAEVGAVNRFQGNTLFITIAKAFSLAKK